MGGGISRSRSKHSKPESSGQVRPLSADVSSHNLRNSETTSPAMDDIKDCQDKDPTIPPIFPAPNPKNLFSRTFPLSSKEDASVPKDSTLTFQNAFAEPASTRDPLGEEVEGLPATGRMSTYVEQDDVLARIRELLAKPDLGWSGDRVALLMSLEELLCSGGQPEDLQVREDLFLNLIQHFFQLLEICKDGNCYFVSVHIALLAADAIECGQPVLEVCNMLRENIEDYVSTFIAQDALRQGALQTMRNNPNCYSAEILELLEATLTSHEADPTSVQLREKLLQLLGHDQKSASTISSQQVSDQFKGFEDKSRLLEIYFNIMGQSGIFGERLELRALAHHCGRPIHLYYLTSWEQMLTFIVDDRPTPSESFNPPFESSLRPLQLFHTVSGRHFHVLVDREGTGTDLWGGLAESGMLNEDTFKLATPRVKICKEEFHINSPLGKESSVEDLVICNTIR